jgi:hypothetical protein
MTMSRISTIHAPVYRGPRLQALRYGEKRRSELNVEHAMFFTLAMLLVAGLGYLMRDEVSSWLAHAAPFTQLIGNS